MERTNYYNNRIHVLYVNQIEKIHPVSFQFYYFIVLYPGNSTYNVS